MNELIELLDQYRQDISFASTGDFLSFHNAMEKYKDFINSYENIESINSFKNSSSFQNYANFFQDHELYYVKKVELESAKKVLLQKQSIIDINFDEAHVQKTINRCYQEFQLIDSSAKNAGKTIKTFAIIGCGPLPKTAIVFSKLMPDANIICLDIDDECIGLAQKVIDLHGMSSNISCQNINGIDLSYKEIDCIFIANYVRPKYDIVVKIFEDNPEAQVLVRNPRYLSNMVYENILGTNLDKYVKTNLVLNGDVRETILFEYK